MAAATDAQRRYLARLYRERDPGTDTMFQHDPSTNPTIDRATASQLIDRLKEHPRRQGTQLSIDVEPVAPPHNPYTSSPATEAQIRLVQELGGDALHAHKLSRHECSAFIDELRAERSQASPETAPVQDRIAVTEPGVYETVEGIFVVKPNRAGTRLYAKRLVEINAERANEEGGRVQIEFEYAPGAILGLTPEDKMDLERGQGTHPAVRSLHQLWATPQGCRERREGHRPCLPQALRGGDSMSRHPRQRYRVYIEGLGRHVFGTHDPKAVTDFLVQLKLGHTAFPAHSDVSVEKRYADGWAGLAEKNYNALWRAVRKRVQHHTKETA